MLDHLSIQCADMAASAAFYDTVLAPVGGRRVMDFGEVIGFGVPPMPDFWIGKLTSGEGFRESHIAFTAPGRPAQGAMLTIPEGPMPRTPRIFGLVAMIATVTLL
jgi:catechol 2,3-dioxygenase-like lactoylglutathione lyase family enzyme